MLLGIVLQSYFPNDGLFTAQTHVHETDIEKALLHTNLGFQLAPGSYEVSHVFFVFFCAVTVLTLFFDSIDPV